MKATRKRIMGLFVCTALLVLCLPVYVFAASPARVAGMKAGAATQSSVNISWETQEGVSGYQIYRSAIYDGKYKKVLDVNPQLNAFCNRNLAAGQEYYYKVRAFTYTDGKVVRGKFSKILRTRTKMPRASKSVVRTRANIRKHAGTGHPVVATVNANTPVKIICAAQDKSGDAWSYISCKVNGRTVKGYIYNNLLRSGQQSVVTQIGKVTASRLNVRASAGNTGKIIGTLKRGQKVTLLGQEKAPDGSVWYLVQFTQNGRTVKGYVSARYIKLV
ncbi:MAG: SH3 domain-containing protein [Eubacterium sp.]|nr:SH3 domain-containing protein [Eubacterium sp.]